MRKTNTTRVALLLLALTLITSCFVGGTFAKYVTGAKIEDVARVAKFGVDVSAEKTDSLFKQQYTKDDTSANIGTYSVKAQGDYDVVAPGTTGDVLGFSITGKPEVAVKVTFALDIQDVVLKAKGADDQFVDYPDMTMRDYVNGNGQYGTFRLTKDYYPVKFTLVNTTNNKTLVENGTAADVKKALEDLTVYCAPNTDLSAKFGSYTLSWAWDFVANTDAAAKVNNAADTLLGNLAVKGTLTDVANYNLRVEADLQIIVEQVD